MNGRALDAFAEVFVVGAAEEVDANRPNRTGVAPVRAPLRRAGPAAVRSLGNIEFILARSSLERKRRNSEFQLRPSTSYRLLQHPFEAVASRSTLQRRQVDGSSSVQLATTDFTPKRSNSLNARLHAAIHQRKSLPSSSCPAP